MVKNVFVRVALLAGLIGSGGWPSARGGDRPASRPASLAEQVASVAEAHRKLYLGGKSAEAGSKTPAMLWHIGELMTRGGDVASRFSPARALGARRNADKLKALVAIADDLKPRAARLLADADRVARRADALADALAGKAGARARAAAAEAIGEPDGASDPAVLLALAAKALRDRPAGAARAESALRELAGRMRHLADLDRWMVLNCRFLHDTRAWIVAHGDALAPRTLCYSIQARANEAAAIQSRVEDVLFAVPAERLLWPALLDRRRAAPAASAPARLPAMTQRIAQLRRDEVALDRDLAKLVHQRKIKQAVARRRKEYLPIVATLEYLQREAAMLGWAGRAAPGDLLVADADARILSLTSRAALARIVKPLEPRARARLKPLLKAMLGREYLGSYVDLCLYQSAVMATEARLAVRLGAWLALSPRPTVRDLMDMLHPTPGVMTTAERSDNAYDPRLMAWAAKCRGRTALARLREAHALVHAFYEAHGYNADQPIYTSRDALDSGLIDCLAGCRLHGAAAAAAGVAGIVPVRYWRATTGHTLLGLRTTDGIIIVDPLTGFRPRPFPGGYGRGVVTVETGAPSFGSYVTDAVEIVATGKLLRRKLPYLDAKPARPAR